ncbi:hypothetical protein S7711_06719 [Stachybotrys chartarum IBT 7711]|uniref:Uncharacterized protein n=1 Tax=Stachybotrys chartarum (strain CBS 109288 / IBT 7711) TaxID=1280523 RepID=A0A084APM3_STACB|nr:hypothetical protein S7711_06719 [Stachybotrys chartarum IBT 7711]KFA47330.1 hypothetical protein S40293_06069 [Stachybotrys chartarum IBT 40293]
MSQPPSTPVKVPSAAANYTPATLDPDLRSQINTTLLRDGHVPRIQEALLHSLNANSSNWPTTIQNHALSLLRSGEITTFPALIQRVLDDVRQDTSSAASGKNGTKASSATANGDATKTNSGSAAEKTSLAIPDAVVEEALKVTRESLEAICEIDSVGGT